MSEPSAMPVNKASRTAWGLVGVGFLPFACLSIGLYVLGSSHPLFASIFDVFKIWSALFLSFLGGVRWGVAISKSPVSERDIILSIIPPSIGWMAMFLQDSYTVLVLLLAYCAMGAWDSFAVNSGIVPDWYGKLRVIFTFLIAAAHVIVFFAIF